MNACPDIIHNPSAATHLSDDQIDDYLIGDLAPAPAAHLATCSLCAARIAAAASSIDSLQALSTAWSERRSATLPIPVPTPPRPLWQPHPAWATACLALALGIALTSASREASLRASVSFTPPALPSLSAPSATADSASLPSGQHPSALNSSLRQNHVPRGWQPGAGSPKLRVSSGLLGSAVRPALAETASTASSRAEVRGGRFMPAGAAAAQISADNHLLRSIDADLDPSSDTPAALGLVSETAQSTPPPTSLQD